ncbi:ras-related protein Rab-10-like [Latimeria chalumnae]|uniref:Ras-related protein Rab-1 n=1 Tax=Latimeria chalumnae TaxID=7897 RepID=M3XHH1_LATCH|nr:PREDICTED: ras-related protein Rab-10-like [Latimeria chalumnae]|eukprot:XP_005998275.1 PREDICTED: ras-related protein Rab-10-like [Latimeria chalumnae]
MANQSQSVVVLKIVLAGDSCVGKTSILNRYSNSNFDSSFISTIGIDFKVKTLTIDGKTVKLQIWDTAGQERFHTLTTNYFRGAHGLVLVYDITNLDSFRNIGGWIRDIDKNAGEDVEKILLGNKCDAEEQRVVSKEKGEKLGWEYGICFYETSAKENTNIENAFLGLVEQIMSKDPCLSKEADSVTLRNSKKKRKCCNR